MPWFYVYNPAKISIRAHEVEDIIPISTCPSRVRLVYKITKKQRCYGYGYSDPGKAYRVGRVLSTWLMERDDEKAVAILCRPRLEKVQELLEDEGKRLAKLVAERDLLEERRIEVIG